MYSPVNAFRPCRALRLCRPARAALGQDGCPLMTVWGNSGLMTKVMPREQPSQKGQPGTSDSDGFVQSSGEAEGSAATRRKPRCHEAAVSGAFLAAWRRKISVTTGPSGWFPNKRPGKNGCAMERPVCWPAPCNCFTVERLLHHALPAPQPALSGSAPFQGHRKTRTAPAVT